ncbi:hypothetical protein [Mycobacterium botniense]|uniref:TetR family transcriptional regulator n=1 Tax=Mycobacterium botniense TaxID=84962 RepID=A0A7I9XT84_9MYCO|nr:hypothetical protein [Mycobacterium botniense]GFG73221.1 hypothetical protein MBOT_05860 [Mycobacterium botniense]
MTVLADAVLPLVRTRAEVWRRSVANAHGTRMHEAVAMLRNAAHGAGDPAEVFAVTQRAIAAALTVIMRADDSSGIIGDAAGIFSSCTQSLRRAPGWPRASSSTG